MDMYDHKKAQVFISYTADDRALVANFVDLLSDEAITAAAVMWYDRNLTPARDWEAEIMERLHNADIVLVLASPRFFQSSYCIGRELPVIRARVNGKPDHRPLDRNALRVIRLRELEKSGPEIDGFPSWPDGEQTLQSVGRDGPQVRELRTWLKVAICKALVSRHADHYDGLPREHQIRDPDKFRYKQFDDLTTIHELYGVDVTPNARLVVGGIAGLFVGAAAGLLTKLYLLPAAMTPVVRLLLFFAIIGFVAGAVKPVFREIEMLGISRRGKSSFKIALREVRFLLFIVILAAFVHAIRGVVLGLLIGVVLWVIDWSFDIGRVAAAAIGAVFCGRAGIDFALSFPSTSKQLKVFTDVRHLYRPPVVKPLPLPVMSDVSTVSTDTSSDESEPLLESEVVDLDPGDDALAAKKDDELEPERDDIWRSPKSPEDVRANLIVVAAAARRTETLQLLAALQNDCCDDVFEIALITEADPLVTDPSYWKTRLRGRVRCLVLMTEELARSSVPAAIASTLVDRPAWERGVYSVLVDSGLSANSPLMNFQGLPTGQMPVRDWPIQQNAWVNVSRSVLTDEVDQFLARLIRYLINILLQEEKKRRSRNYSASSDVETFLHEKSLHDYHFDLCSGETFADPRHDLSHFPFKHRAWYWSKLDAMWWAVAGAITLGFGNDIAVALASPDASSFERFARHILPPVVFALALAYLVLKDTVHYAKLRLRRPDHEDTLSGVLGFLTGWGFRVSPFTPKRRPIVSRAARLMLRPLGLLVPVTLLLVDSGDSFSLAGGAAVGLACYLVTRYRVPAVVIPCRPAPTPHDAATIRRRLTWTIRTARRNFPEIERGAIGSVPSPQPRLIPAYWEGLSISVWMVVRAVLDAIWITVAGIALLVGLLRLGLHFILAMWVAAYVMSVILQVLGYRYRPFVFRINDESWLQAVWHAYRRVLPRALGTTIYMLAAVFVLVFVLVVFTDVVVKATGRMIAGIMIVGIIIAAFCVRMFHQIINTSESPPL